MPIDWLAQNLPVLAICLIGMIALVYSLSCVVRNDVYVWNLRNEVRQIRYSYETQLLRMTLGEPAEAPIEVDIVEEEPDAPSDSSASADAISDGQELDASPLSMPESEGPESPQSAAA